MKKLEVQPKVVAKINPEDSMNFFEAHRQENLMKGNGACKVCIVFCTGFTGKIGGRCNCGNHWSQHY